jgi:hypothetical protein
VRLDDRTGAVSLTVELETAVSRRGESDAAVDGAVAFHGSP